MTRPFRRGRTRFKMSLRERVERNNANDAFYASCYDQEPKFQTELPPKRTYTKRDALDIDAVHRKQPVPLEKEVIRAVGELLAKHPSVLFALRMNSGAASYEAKSGKWAPVWFHTWLRAPKACRMSDFFGAMTDARMLALECKRPGWTKPTDAREREQAAFLEVVRQSGGIGAFVTSVDDAARLLA